MTPPYRICRLALHLLPSQSYEVRYLSLSVVDLNIPGRVLRSVSDAEFREYYYKLHGGGKWEEDMRRDVSLVVVKDRSVLQR